MMARWLPEWAPGLQLSEHNGNYEPIFDEKMTKVRADQKAHLRLALKMTQVALCQFFLS